MSKSPGNLYVVSAPSGGGKTSLTRALVPALADKGITATISISYTTRAPRPGEQDGVHYHFVDEVRFKEMIGRGEFLEHAEVFGRRYGTGKHKTEALLVAGHDVILDIDWQGWRQVKTLAPQSSGIFILPPSVQALEQRLRARGQDSDEVISRRMAQARDEISHCDEYDSWIINDSFDLALQELSALFVARRQGRQVLTPRPSALLVSLLAK